MSFPFSTGHFRPVEEEKDSKHKVHPGPEDHGGEKGGKRSGPKKLFKWNEEIRSDITLDYLNWFHSSLSSLKESHSFGMQKRAERRK